MEGHRGREILRGRERDNREKVTDGDREKERDRETVDRGRDRQRGERKSAVLIEGVAYSP